MLKEQGQFPLVNINFHGREQKNSGHDLVVVGGGPAGLSAAKTAAGQNVDTVLMEQQPKIGNPLKTSGAIIEREKLGIPEEICHPISKIRIISPNNQVIIPLEDGTLDVVDLEKFYHFLEEGARKAGVKILLNTQGTEPIVQDGFVKGVRAQSRSMQDIINIESNLTIDASGIPIYTNKPSIARKAGIEPNTKRFGVGGEFEFIAPDFDQSEMILILGQDVAPVGYAWCIPWGKERVKIGIGVLRPNSTVQPKAQLEKLIPNLSRFGINIKGARRSKEYHAGIIPSDGLSNDFVGNGIMAVGDFAGQVSPLSAEGLRYGMLAGKLAGNATRKAVDKNDYSKRFLVKEYQAPWKKEYWKNSAIAHLFSKIIFTGSDNKLDLFIEMLNVATPYQASQFIRSNLYGLWPLDVLRSHPKQVLKFLLTK